MSSIIRTPFRTVLGVLLVFSLAACEDDPTTAHTYRHVAGGVEWVAVTVPTGLPGARAWLPYLESSDRIEVDRMLDRSNTALRERQYHAALRLRLDAEEAIAKRVTAPSARVLFASLSALEVWSDRVSQEFDLALPEGIGTDVAAVRELRRRASAALEAGDTVAAARTLAAAGMRVRRYEPMLVALEALPRVERELRAIQETSDDARRALRLLHTAGESLVSGDEVRALRRTLYALQIAGRIPRESPHDP